MEIHHNDFIQIEFTTKIKATGQVIDTTNPEIAKRAGLNKKNIKPIIICVGQGSLLKSVETRLEGKPIGQPLVLEIEAGQAYGQRNASLITVIPVLKFTKEKINPFPGLVVNVDGKIGAIKSVTSGRVRVDFNHPLAGKDLVFDIMPLKKIESKEEQVTAVIGSLFNIPESAIHIKVATESIEINLPYSIKKEGEQILEDQIKQVIKGIKKISFTYSKINESVTNTPTKE